MASSSSPLDRIPETLRKKVRPFRAITGSSAAPVSNFSNAAAKIEKWVRKQYPSKRYSSWKYTHQELFAAGLSTKSEKTLAKERAEAHALLGDFTIAKLKDLSLETLAVAEAMVWHMSYEHSLAAAIAEARGLGDAVRVIARAAHLDVESDHGYTTAIHVAPMEDGGHYRGDGPTPLREIVCAAPQKIYDDARKVAEELRSKKSSSEEDRILLSFAFPDEPWGTIDLAASFTKKRAAHTDNPAKALLGVTRDIASVKEWLEKYGGFYVGYYAIDLTFNVPSKELVPVFEAAIEKLLEKPKHGPLHKTPPRNVAEGLVCLATKESAAVLAKYANHAILGPMALAFFRDHPELGAALEAQAKGKGGKLASATARVLKKRSGDDEDAPAQVAAAKTSDLPSVLVDPPWRRSKRTTKKVTTTTIVVDPLPLRGLDLERVVVRNKASSFDASYREMTKKELAEWKKNVEKDGYAHCDHEHRSIRAAGGGVSYEYLRVPEKEGLWAWTEHNAYLSDGYLPWVQKHGTKTIPGFLRRDWVRWLGVEGEDDLLDAVKSLISPRIAQQFAAVAKRRKHHRFATTWLVENAEVAAYGLIPDALLDPDKDKNNKEKRHNAERALTMMARHHQGNDALIRKIAKTYGKEATRAIDELLNRDPLDVGDVVTVPKAPPFLRIEDLPQVLLRKKKVALDSKSVEALVEMLRFTQVDDPYAGIAIIRDEACDPSSLGDFAIELFEQWVIADAPGRHDWMLNALVHFPSEKGTRRLAELAREWARKNGAKAERACTALAQVASDLALMHLAHIAETTRFASLKKAASELVREAATARDLTEDELGDRTVPDAGLGANGSIELTFGPRTFVVTADPSLAPLVREKSAKGTRSVGAASHSLPRPQKTDNASEAKKAREQFDAFKKDLAAIAQRQVRRLERAMALGRTWSVTDFETRIASHPLLRHIARALVWEQQKIVKGKERAASLTFRIAEDGTYADAKDKAVKLANAGAAIRIAHPARTADLGKTWSTVFGDYEIVQPFEQLGRAVAEPTAAEKKAKALDRAASISAPARKLLGTMESRGWRRNDNGHVTAWLKTLEQHSQQVEVRWPITPGIAMEYMRSGGAKDDVVKTEPLVAIETKNGKPMSLGSLDPVAFSEIARDIEAVRNLTNTR